MMYDVYKRVSFCLKAVLCPSIHCAARQGQRSALPATGPNCIKPVVCTSFLCLILLNYLQKKVEKGIIILPRVVLIMAFYLDLSGILSGSLSGKLANLLTFYISGMHSGLLSGKSSKILSF